MMLTPERADVERAIEDQLDQDMVDGHEGIVADDIAQVEAASTRLAARAEVLDAMHETRLYQQALAGEALLYDELRRLVHYRRMSGSR